MTRGVKAGVGRCRVRERGRASPMVDVSSSRSCIISRHSEGYR